MSDCKGQIATQGNYCLARDSCGFAKTKKCWCGMCLVFWSWFSRYCAHNIHPLHSIRVFEIGPASASKLKRRFLFITTAFKHESGVPACGALAYGGQGKGNAHCCPRKHNDHARWTPLLSAAHILSEATAVLVWGTKSFLPLHG